MSPNLTRAVIVDVAFEVLGEVGIDGLTVRALAARLGVKAPALYWHLEGKQALLDEMGTEVARRIASSLDDLPPELELADALRAYAGAMRTEYLRHRDGARTFSGTWLVDPDVLRRQEAGLARWVSAGVPVDVITDAFEIVTAFVVGFVIEEQERSQSGPDRYDLDRRDAVLGDDHPLTVASGRRLFSHHPDARFASHLDRIVPAVARQS